MPSLVAVPQAGQGFVEVLRRLWDEGAAVFPLDLRYPPEMSQAVLDSVRPTEVWDEQGRRPLPGGEPAAEGDAVVLATSGTTGVPKGVVLTVSALEAAARLTSDALAVDPDADTWLCCAPVAHAGGLGVVNRALRTGTPLIVHPGFDPAALNASDGTLTALVPTMLARIDPAAFRLILLGGMAMPADRPANTVATYGLTETMGGVVYDSRPLPGVELRIGPGDEIEVRSPTALRCYRTEDGEQDPRDAEGWLRTGDIGEIDAGGLLRVHGRSDEVVITGGEKVWPEAVEAVLRRLPGIADAAVVGRPDPEWGQMVVAFIEPPAGHAPPTLAEARAAVKEVLPAWFAPRLLEVVSALPRTPSGKVRRQELA
ncbi:MAG: fatty acid--CoA ligase family protein [Acidimicrobiales bacterium]